MPSPELIGGGSFLAGLGASLALMKLVAENIATKLHAKMLDPEHGFVGRAEFERRIKPFEDRANRAPKLEPSSL